MSFDCCENCPSRSKDFAMQEGHCGVVPISREKCNRSSFNVRTAA